MTEAYWAQGGYAIAKHRGPWASGDMLHTEDNYSGGGEICDFDLVDMFNNDPLVQFTLSQNDQDPLFCENNILSSQGDAGVSWGSDDHACSSISITYSVSDDGEIDIINWTETVVSCDEFEELSTATLQAVSNITINHIYPGHTAHVLSVKIPTDKDPRLVPVPKTVLDSGLYEFNIIMNDGSIVHHYEDFGSAVVINANFADFANINIYPVPVKDRFSVDFDLLAPMDINMTVVDNMGHQYYQKDLQFNLAGRNKVVVDMNPQWPTGLYHAIFQFTDGSTQSLNFTVSAQ